jgi:hypothetical protein
MHLAPAEGLCAHCGRHLARGEQEALEQRIDAEIRRGVQIGLAVFGGAALLVALWLWSP